MVTPAGKAVGAAGEVTAGTTAGAIAASVARDSLSATAASGSAAAQMPPKEVLNDAQIAAVTEGVNTAEIQQAELARSKSRYAPVRSFAAMMIEHHGEAKRKQAQLKLPQAPSALSRQLAEDAKTSLEKLKRAAGTEFDRTYLQAQADGHQTVLDALNRDLIPQVKDKQLQTYLTELKPKVEHHLMQARADINSLPSTASSPAASFSASPSTASSSASPSTASSSGGTASTAR